MESSNSSYKERGSEASTADSLGIKDAAKESSKGQNFEQRTAGNAGLTELVVHEALGIDSRVSMEMNLAGFKQIFPSFLHKATPFSQIFDFVSFSDLARNSFSF